MTPPEKHLTPAELAEREGVTLDTIYRWNWLKRGPRFIKFGRAVRYKLSDVEAWENSRIVDGEGATGAEKASA
jgi:excisionase family DNA binding protein